MERLGDDPGSLQRAAERLREGGLVAFPTETVYGLGADAQNGQAVARIFEAKGRPHFNPLIVHVLDLAHVSRFGVVNERAERLARAFWPGPLTMVLPRNQNCALSELVSAGHSTVAFRSPGHPVARHLLENSQIPIAAPSANPSGYLSPTRADHVAHAFEGINGLLIDGGACQIGLESTVIDLSSDGLATLLRSGDITLEDISKHLDDVALPPADAPLLSPGMLASHYAPHKPLRMNAGTARDADAVLAFGNDVPPGGAHHQNLSKSGDLIEAAANLFEMLHIADRQDVTGIAVAAIPVDGLGAAINDRLRRAAHGD
jgi:L-threonylcarbamoyladenylate synthase